MISNLKCVDDITVVLFMVLVLFSIGFGMIGLLSFIDLVKSEFRKIKRGHVLNGKKSKQ